MDTFNAAASLFQHGNVSFDATFTGQLVAGQIAGKDSIDSSRGSLTETDHFIHLRVVGRCYVVVG